MARCTCSTIWFSSGDDLNVNGVVTHPDFMSLFDSPSPWPYGEGLCINAGRTSTFHLTGIHTIGTNVVIGPGVSQILLDGGGQEKNWTFSIDPASRSGISFPSLSQPFAQ